ncbi:MAG: hypothetical protein HFI90_02575 [Clostridia bacterium]|nr:hypothetical protein [Clostridia bacterium]
MKKMIAIILTMIIMVGMATVPGVAITGDSDTELDSRVEVLLELGIFDSFVGTADVTRYTVRETLNRIMGDDVAATKFFGETYMDGHLTVDNVVAILLDVLGYTEYVELVWESYNASSRLIVAQQIKLIKSSIKTDEQLTMDLYAQLLWNALFEVNTLDVTMISGSNVKYQEGDTLGEKRLNLQCISGIVEGVCDTNIKRGISSGKSIIINGVQYKYQTIHPEKYIGRYVQCFVNKDSDEVKAVRIMESKNEVWTISAEDIIAEKTTLTNLYYIDERQRQRTIALDDVDVIYNGLLFETITDATLIQTDGIYTLIDNDKDGKAEIILLDVYLPQRVEIVSKGTNATYLTSATGEFYDFKEYYKDGRCIEDANGKTVDWIEISKNDVLLIRRGALPGAVNTGAAVTDMNRVIWSMDKVNGELRTIDSESKILGIDEQEYKLTPFLFNDKERLKKVKPGDDVTCFMDAFGRIADISVYNSQDKVAAVLELYEGKGLEMPALKCLTEDNKIEYLRFKSKIVLDGQKIDAKQVLSSTYESMFYTGGAIKEQLVKLKLNSKNEITALTTADGIEGDDFNRLPINASYYDAGDGTRILNGKYIADLQTVVFDVWRDEDSFCNASVKGTIGYGDSGKYTLYCIDEETNRVGYVLNTYKKVAERNNFDVWGLNNAYLVVGSGVKIDTRTGDTVKFLRCWNGDREVEMISRDQDLQTTGHTSNSLAYLTANANKGTNHLYSALYNQVGWNGGGWKTRKFVDLEPGTVISVNIFDGYVAAFDICFAPDRLKEDIKNGTWNTLPFEGCPNYNNNNTYYGISATSFYHELLYAYGEVQRVSSYGPVVNNHLPTDAEIKAVLPDGVELTDESVRQMMNGQSEYSIFPVVSWERLYWMDASTKVWFFDLERQKMISGDLGDLCPGDRVFVRRQQGNTLMIVYR